MHKNKIDKKIIQAREMARSCRFCARACGVDRTAGQQGFCGQGARARVAAHLLHFGEEPPLVGAAGSGTIFFSGCSMACVFCQNWQISQENQGEEVTEEQLSEMMLELERSGALNINLVSPTPHLATLVPGLVLARKMGLSLPVAYNTNGYDSLAALELLDGLVDIWLPDAKYAADKAAISLSAAPGYVAASRAGLAWMLNNTGYLETDKNGVALRGLLVRHLVLPGGLSQTQETLGWIRKNLGRFQPVSLMSQYTPLYRAPSRPGPLARPLAPAEYQAAVERALALGLEETLTQELDSQGFYVPDFERKEIF